MSEDKRERSFIAIYILIASIFGLSTDITKFFFPETGEQIYRTIQFYFFIIVGFLSLNFRYVATIPPVIKIIPRYIISFILFYIAFIILFGTGYKLIVPNTDTVILETVVSFSENLLLLYLIPPVWNYGTYGGSLFNRVRFHLPAIIIISLLHVGSYSLRSSNVPDFFFALIYAFVMFIGFVAIKELLGFGTSEGAHAAINTALISSGLKII